MVYKDIPSLFGLDNIKSPFGVAHRLGHESDLANLFVLILVCTWFVSMVFCLRKIEDCGVMLYASSQIFTDRSCFIL